jgi:hypothetical protein
MGLMVRCRCGHAIHEHATQCRIPDCGCMRDRFDALECALDLVAEQRRPPDVHRLRLVAGGREAVEA